MIQVIYVREILHKDRTLMIINRKMNHIAIQEKQINKWYAT